MTRHHNGTRRRGAVIVMVAAGLLTLFLFGALAVDVGYICALTAEQQNIADSASLAGASGLQDADSTVALERAMDYIERNQKPQGFLSLDDQVIHFGWWDSVNNKFHVSKDPRQMFAIRVRAARNRVPLFFAALMGKTSTNIKREAVAVGSKPCGGIWGLEGVRVPGNVVTDSFISSDGPYDAQNRRENGDVCSGRDIIVNGSITINGDAMAGLGYAIEVSGKPIITGLTTSTLENVVPPPVDFGDVTFNNDNETIGLTDLGEDPFSSGAHLSINSFDNLTLETGTYYFDSLTVNADGRLTLTGPTTIYVSGNIKTAGSAILGASMDPAHLTIISSGSAIDMRGDSSLYGQILAPYADIQLGGDANAYGAVIGRTVKMHGNFNFHVDESLPFAQPWFDPPPPMLVK